MTQWLKLDKAGCDVCRDGKDKEVLVLTGNPEFKRVCWLHLKSIVRYENMLDGKEPVRS